MELRSQLQQINLVIGIDSKFLMMWMRLTQILKITFKTKVTKMKIWITTWEICLKVQIAPMIMMRIWSTTRLKILNPMMRMLRFMLISKLKEKINKSRKFPYLVFHLVASVVRVMELSSQVKQVLLHLKHHLLIWELSDKHQISNRWVWVKDLP